MKNIFYILLLFVISSCKTTEYVVKEKVINDTVIIDKTVTDTIYRETEKIITKDVEINTFLPCDESDNEGNSRSGDNEVSWIYDSIRKGYNIRLYCAEQISKRDSINRTLREKLKHYQSSTTKEVEEVKVVKENKNFFDKLFHNIYKLLFFILLPLWVLGISPKKLLNI